MPASILRRQGNKNEAVDMGGDVVEVEDALAFLGAAHAQCEQPAESAVSSAVLRIGEQTRRICKIEAATDDEFDAADLLRGKVRADHAGKRVAVGNGDGIEPKRLGRRH